MPVLPQPLSLNPLKDMVKADKVDYSTDFDNLSSKMDDFDKFFRTGKVSYNMLRYIPGLAKVGYQGQLHSAETKRKYADDTYKSKKVIKFNIQLKKGHYTNFQNDHLCFHLKIKLAADKDNDITAGVIKKMRLCVTGYYLGECLYSVSREGLIMNYREYGVNKQKHAIS